MAARPPSLHVPPPPGFDPLPFSKGVLAATYAAWLGILAWILPRRKFPRNSIAKFSF